MTSRERVGTALSFQEPDRVPTAIGGGPYGIVDETYFKLLRYFNLGEPVKPFRTGHNISYLDNRILDALGTDIRYIYPTLSPSSPIHQTNNPDILLDSFGQSWKRAAPYYYVIDGLLKEAHTINQIEELVRWPDPNDEKWFSGLKERCIEINNGKYWITARMITSHGPFQTACDLRGTENFLADLSINPDFAMALLERIGKFICDFTKKYLSACGDQIHMIELPGDDYAGNENPIISPMMFRKFFQPVLKKMVGCIKSFRADLKVMLHSDGAITKLLPDLIACGIDVIHPLEPLEVTDQFRIKAQYGSQVCFLGGIDISHATLGSKTDVRNEVRRCMQALAPGGGFILAPSNHLQADVPPENIVQLFEDARVYGNYPINLGGI